MQTVYPHAGAAASKAVILSIYRCVEARFHFVLLPRRHKCCAAPLLTTQLTPLLTLLRSGALGLQLPCGVWSAAAGQQSRPGGCHDAKGFVVPRAWRPRHAAEGRSMCEAMGRMQSTQPLLWDVQGYCVYSLAELAYYALYPPVRIAACWKLP